MQKVKDTQNIIGLRDLRENLKSYSEKIAQGNSFMVVKRSKPIFKIIPPFSGKQEEKWEEAIDFTKIKKGGVEIDELIARL